MEEKINFANVVQRLEETNSVAIYNYREGVRVLSSYRYRGNVFKWKDAAFADDFGVPQSEHSVKIPKGITILNKESDKAMIKFLAGEFNEDGSPKQGSVFKGYPNIKNSIAFDELHKEGKASKAFIEFIEPKRYKKEKEGQTSSKKNAFKLLNKVTDKEDLIKMVAFALKSYPKNTTVRTMETDLFDYVEAGNYDAFMKLFKDDKTAKLHDAYEQISLFRRGVSDGLIELKSNQYYYGGSLLGYQESSSVAALVEDKERWGHFLSALSKV